MVHDRSRITIDPRLPAIPGRSTSGFHQPGRHCLHQRGGLHSPPHPTHASAASVFVARLPDISLSHSASLPPPCNFKYLLIVYSTRPLLEKFWAARSHLRFQRERAAVPLQTRRCHRRHRRPRRHTWRSITKPLLLILSPLLDSPPHGTPYYARGRRT